ncbi:MAG: hypothetical protein EOL90_12110 [Spartobacteria bacterium]|nr:hypothetical protein [Spartobacteria bacterium]
MWKIDIKAPFGGFLRKYYLDDYINVGANNQANDMKCISLNKSSYITPGYTPAKTEETSEVIYKFSNLDSQGNSYGISNTKVFQVGSSVTDSANYPHTISGAAAAGFWNNIVVYKDNLYYFWHTFSGGDIGKATSITATPSFDDDWGSTEDDNLEEGDYTPVYVTLDNILIFGNGQYLGWYDGTTLDTKFYDFGSNLRIKAITEQGGYIYIAVNNKNSDLGYIYIINNNIDSDVSIIDMINVGDQIDELYTVNGIIYVFHRETMGEDASKIGYISGNRIIELDIFYEGTPSQIEFVSDIMFFTSEESVLGLSTPYNSNQFLLTRPLDVVSGTSLGGGGLKSTGSRLLHSYSGASKFYVEFYNLTSKGIDAYWTSKTWITSTIDELSMIDSIFVKTNALEEDAKCNLEIYTNRSGTASKTLEISGENKTRHIFRNLGISGIEEFKIKLDFSVGKIGDVVEIQEIQIGGHTYQL